MFGGCTGLLAPIPFCACCPTAAEGAPRASLLLSETCGKLRLTLGHPQGSNACRVLPWISSPRVGGETHKPSAACFPAANCFVNLHSPGRGRCITSVLRALQLGRQRLPVVQPGLCLATTAGRVCREGGLQTQAVLFDGHVFCVVTDAPRWKKLK